MAKDEPEKLGDIVREIVVEGRVAGLGMLAAALQKRGRLADLKEADEVLADAALLVEEALRAPYVTSELLEFKEKINEQQRDLRSLIRPNSK